MAEDECPRACRVTHEQHEARIDKLEQGHTKDINGIYDKVDDNYKHWEAEVGKRAKTTTLIALSSVVVTVLIVMFGVLYKQGRQLEAQVHEVQIEVATMVGKMDSYPGINHRYETERP